MYICYFVIDIRHKQYAFLEIDAKTDATGTGHARSEVKCPKAALKLCPLATKGRKKAEG